MQVFFSAAIDIFFAVILGFVLVYKQINPKAKKVGNKILRSAAVLLIAAVAALLILGTLEITETDFAGLATALLLVVRLSAFGNMALLALISALAILILVITNKSLTLSINNRSLILCLAIFAYAKAGIGHAADFGILHVLVLTHAIHIFAASAWVGSVIASILLIKQWRFFKPQESNALAQHLSNIATIAVPLTLLAGIIDSIRILYESNQILGSAYFYTLSLKVSLVVIAIILGLINRWYWMPKISYGQAAGFIHTIKIEAIGLFIVLIAAAKLGFTMIPN